MISRRIWTKSRVTEALDGADHDRVVAVLRESVTLAWEVGDSFAMVERLENLAGVAVAQGHPVHAARLFGAAEAGRVVIGSPIPPIARPRYERMVAMAPAHLDEAVCEAAWAEGRGMPVEQATAEASGEVAQA